MECYLLKVGALHPIESYLGSPLVEDQRHDETQTGY
jgi:hypothetical protein